MAAGSDLVPVIHLGHLYSHQDHQNAPHGSQLHGWPANLLVELSSELKPLCTNFGRRHPKA